MKKDLPVIILLIVLFLAAGGCILAIRGIDKADSERAAATLHTNQTIAETAETAESNVYNG